ncbi:MAG: Gfo/Idh/MocA family protein [Victivallaceae bacterium]
MNKVKLGLIGVGNMGSMHVKSIGELNNCELAAICDRKESVLDRYADAPFAKFRDTETFFKAADIDAVLIAVPHYSHVPLALQSLELGKHVIVEKPIAVEKADACRLVAAIKAHPELKVAAMFNQRTIPAHRKIKQLIDSGELGAIRRVNWIITDWFRSQSYYDSGEWRASWRGEGGGVLINQCPHQLDLMQWFFGMPDEVYARMSFGKYHKIEVEDDVTAFLSYPGGATGVFIASTGEAPGTNRLEITAERGRLVFEGGKLSFLRNEIETAEFCRTTPTFFERPPVWEAAIPAEAGNPHAHRDIIENFCTAVLTGSPLLAPAEEGIRGLELGNAMLLSHLASRPVKLPIDAAEFSNHLAKLIANSTYQKTEVAAGTPPPDLSQSYGA